MFRTFLSILGQLKIQRAIMGIHRKFSTHCIKQRQGNFIHGLLVWPLVVGKSKMLSPKRPEVPVLMGMGWANSPLQCGIHVVLWPVTASFAFSFLLELLHESLSLLWSIPRILAWLYCILLSFSALLVLDKSSPLHNKSICHRMFLWLLESKNATWHW